MRSPEVRIEEFLPTRRSLLTRLKNWDDEEGWREFFDTYWKLIYSVAIKAGLNETEAEDLVQDTVLSVARKMKNFHYNPEAGSFKSWLLLNVRSRIIDHLRRRRRRIVTISPAAEQTARTSLVERQPDSEGNRLEAIWEEEWNRRLTEVVLERVKLKVSARHYQIFDLYVLQAIPLRQVKETLGVSTAQIYVTKHRISNLLRKEVGRLEAKML